MASPFPGMDPYLEGYLWPDVHQRLANAIAELLVPALAPKYVARIELYTVMDTSPEGEVGMLYPDVEVLQRLHQAEEPPAPATAASAYPPLTPVTVSLPALLPVELRIPVVQVLDRANNQLVTAIELLSPVNKREPGLAPCREKCRKLLEAGVHLLEIDLLRRGQRPYRHPRLPDTHYLAALYRAHASHIDIWAFNVQDALPVLPVPLRPPDPDVPLDLGAALRLIYERGLYQLSINYRQAPPPPDFSAEDQAWVTGITQSEES
jgi:hypothetical protein